MRHMDGWMLAIPLFGTISTDFIVSLLLLAFPIRAETLTPEFCVVSFISLQRLKSETLAGQRRGVRYPI